MGKHHEEKLEFTFFSDRSIQTIGQLVVSGINSTDPSYIENIYFRVLDEFRSWKYCPLLLVFDEVNALFSVHSKKTDYVPAYDPPFNFASTLNLVDMVKGWKLISGTGHEKFLDNIPPGIERCVERLYPYDIRDFNTLINITGHEWLLNTLKSIGNQNIKEKIDFLIKNTLGRVPRQLYLFNEYLTKEFSKTPPHNYFAGISAPQDQIQHMLSKFEFEQKEVFLQQSTKYLASQDPDQKKWILENTFQLFLGYPNSKFAKNTSKFESGPIFSRSYLDQSLIYKNEERIYKFITPAAEFATVELLQKQYSFDGDKDVQDITNSYKTNDEKARAFERLFAKHLLIGFHEQMEVVTFDGQILENLDFTCHSTRIIPDGQWCISDKFNNPTLLIPESSSYPIADLILFNPKKNLIIVFQITLQKHLEKSPSHGYYSALYDTNQWVKLCQQIKWNSRSNNFIEEIFSSLVGSVQVLVTGDLKKEEPIKIQIQTTNQPSSSYQFYWVIVCPRKLPNVNNELKQTAISYPWAKLLPDQSLKKIFGDTMINILQG